MASLLIGIAGKLLGELCSPFLQDVGKSWGFGTKSEFEKLKATLSAIEAVLLVAEEKQKRDPQLQDWLKKIKRVFYDIEDLLQEISTETLKRQVKTRNKKAKKVRIFFSRSNQVMYRLKMGGKIKLIREELDSIASDRNSFNLTERKQEIKSTSTIREETYSFVPVDKVIGRDDDKKAVTELLLHHELDAENDVSVISIVGIGGLGKTTLAQSIYSLKEVEEHFELMMWVCVSDVFDVKLICRKIIESATKIECAGSLQMDVVKDKLKRAIDGRRYLLVLDDVWNESPTEWMKLEELLLMGGGAKGSRVLVTARAKLVARAAKSVAIHSLKGLSNEDSWSLFKQAAFERGVEPPSGSAMARIGREIVEERCAGVPLAIKTIGSLLRLKETEKDWLDFEANDLPRITRDGEGDIVPILKLSYDYLPAPLKRCFLYCAVFPKDFPIKKDVLIRMWMAHGIIQLDGTRRSLEDVGEKHFTELLNRSLFEVHDRYRRVVYKMHDLIHDLAQSIGGDEYSSSSNCSSSSIRSDVDETTRHACVPDCNFTVNAARAKKLRTLFSVVFSGEMCGCAIDDETMSNLEHLRVLVLARSMLFEVPGFVGGFRHLSFLDLSYNPFYVLPESICNLYNLQTLILECCLDLEELPEGTRNLVSLRHLDIYGCDKLSRMPPGLGELTCLRTLADFVMGPPEGRKKNCCWGGGLGELKSLVNLRGELRIRNLGGRGLSSEEVGMKCKRSRSCGQYPPADDDLFFLTRLGFVRSLSLNWTSYGEDKMEEREGEALFESLKPHPNLEELFIRCADGFERFPSWMIGVCLPNIVFIRLWGCRSLRHLPPFGLLPSLRELHLWEMGGIEYICENEDGDDEKAEDQWEEDSSNTSSSKAPDTTTLFPSLRKLKLTAIPKLARLVGRQRRPRGAAATSPGGRSTSRHFPVLEQLDIHSCPNLFVADDEAAEEGKQLLTLRELYLNSVPSWLQYVPNLETLYLSDCTNVETLPEWMGNLTSLQEIYLKCCLSLATLPDCMRRLTSLQRLRINLCPKLNSRCNKETGEDWPNIAHIPNIFWD